MNICERATDLKVARAVFVHLIGVDAVTSTRVPVSLGACDGKIARRFPDYRAVEAAYFKRTGFSPVVHTLAVRRRLVEQYPDLPANLFRAFSAARDLTRYAYEDGLTARQVAPEELFHASTHALTA